MEDERRIDTEPDEAFDEVLGDVDAHPLLGGAAGSARARGGDTGPASAREAPPDPEPVVDRSQVPGVCLYEEAGRQVVAPEAAQDHVLAQGLREALMDRLDRGVLRYRLDLSGAGDLGAQSLAMVVAFGRMLAERGGEMEITGAVDPLALLLAAAPVNGVRLAVARRAE